MITAFHHRRAAPLILVAAALLSACDGADMEINGKKGVPLAELAALDTPPSEVVLASGDTVVITQGETFAIAVEGGNTESLRFVRDQEVIGITREKGSGGPSDATIRITMPAPRELVIAGSGTIRTPTLASTASVSVGGTGLVEFGTLAAEKLDINIAGNGTIRGAGTVRTLAINIGGNGEVELQGLKADTADVAIGGAGDVAFASDGTVNASIAGAGDVVVTGSAKCTVSTLGSGTLTCDAPPASTAPAAPAAPSGTGARSAE